MAASGACPGLRREEVALRAGISVEWYTRLERGVARGVSDEVLDAIGSALQLDEAERAHLADLVRTANAERPPRRSSTPQRVRPSIARIVDVMGPMPACVTNGRLDVLYANDLAEALFSDVFRDRVRPANFARFVFLDPRARTFYRDWEKAANDTVAVLRAAAGRNPYDRACPTWSGSSRLVATSSGCAGRGTTSPSIARPPSRCTIRWWAT